MEEKNKTVLGQKATLDAESRRKELTIPPELWGGKFFKNNK